MLFLCLEIKKWLSSLLFWVLWMLFVKLGLLVVDSSRRLWLFCVILGSLLSIKRKWRSLGLRLRGGIFLMRLFVICFMMLVWRICLWCSVIWVIMFWGGIWLIWGIFMVRGWIFILLVWSRWWCIWGGWWGWWRRWCIMEGWFCLWGIGRGRCWLWWGWWSWWGCVIFFRSGCWGVLWIRMCCCKGGSLRLWMRGIGSWRGLRSIWGIVGWWCWIWWFVWICWRIMCCWGSVCWLWCWWWGWLIWMLIWVGLCIRFWWMMIGEFFLNEGDGWVVNDGRIVCGLWFLLWVFWGGLVRGGSRGGWWMLRRGLWSGRCLRMCLVLLVRWMLRLGGKLRKNRRICRRRWEGWSWLIWWWRMRLLLRCLVRGLFCLNISGWVFFFCIKI